MHLSSRFRNVASQSRWFFEIMQYWFSCHGSSRFSEEFFDVEIKGRDRAHVIAPSSQLGITHTNFSAFSTSFNTPLVKILPNTRSHMCSVRQFPGTTTEHNLSNREWPWLRSQFQNGHGSRRKIALLKLRFPLVRAV